MWGADRLGRLFGSEMGTQVAWLLPAALVLRRRRAVAAAPRDRAPTGRRAAVLLWGGWLLLTGAVFSFAQGIIHPYYTVALAPAIGALVGIGSVSCCGGERAHAVGRAGCWARPWRARPCGRTCCSAARPTGCPLLRVLVLVGGLGVGGALAFARRG